MFATRLGLEMKYNVSILSYKYARRMRICRVRETSELISNTC